MIALLGNPFSPAYARARAKAGAPRALSFCAMNVAVRGPRGAAWSLTERSIADSARSPRGVVIGDSSMAWMGDELVVSLAERTAPFGRPLRGEIRFHPDAPPADARSLDDRGAHAWWPIAPSGQISVAFDAPALRFRGRGYHDGNAGDEPLEEAFSRWTWSRTSIGPRCTRVTYDTTPRFGVPRSHALDLDASGSVVPVEGLEWAPLRTTGWGIPRATRVARGSAVRILAELLDAPFYSRALLASDRGGLAMHESFSGDRLRARWVQFLLGFRMGRA